MKKLIKIIDKDIVDTLNKARQVDRNQGPSKVFWGQIAAFNGPRLTWIKLISPVMALATPLAFLKDPAKTYWMFFCLAVALCFFLLYFYRLAVIQQQWLDRHEVDQFGAYKASPDELYEVPPD